MKTMRTTMFLLIALAITQFTNAQKRDLDNFRPRDQRGINVFEEPKDTTTTFENLKVRIGGASTLQYQSINHENSGAVPLVELGDNFNLATAN